MRWFPFLAWPKPNAALLRSEAVAGLTVGLMVIPQGVAYATLAHMPLVTGIYAAMLPALVGVLFGGSSRLSVGPTALTCLMVSAALTGMASPGSPDWVMLVIWLSLLTGLFQLALGVLRFGWLLNIVNAPVLTAFTQAGGRKIDRWTDQHRTVVVPFDRPGDDPQAFFNANTLAELQSLEGG